MVSTIHLSSGNLGGDSLEKKRRERGRDRDDARAREIMTEREREREQVRRSLGPAHAISPLSLSSLSFLTAIPFSQRRRPGLRGDEAHPCGVTARTGRSLNLNAGLRLPCSRHRSVFSCSSLRSLS